MFSGRMSANIPCQTVIHEYNGPRIIMTPTELAGSCSFIINSSSDISVHWCCCSRVRRELYFFRKCKLFSSFSLELMSSQEKSSCMTGRDLICNFKTGCETQVVWGWWASHQHKKNLFLYQLIFPLLLSNYWLIQGRIRVKAADKIQSSVKK